MASGSSRPVALRPALGPGLLGAAWPFAVVFGLSLLIQLVIRPSIGAYPEVLLVNVGISVVLAVSLTMVNGFTGQFSIGHAGFLAVGGYTAGAITYYSSLLLWKSGVARGGLLSGMPRSTEGLALATPGDFLFLGALLAGGLVAAAVGVVVGLPSLRLRGDYLAIVTLGFGEIVRVLIQQTEPLVRTAQAASETSIPRLAVSLGGSLGFGEVPKYTSLFWVSLMAGVTLVTAYRLKTSTHGRAFLAIREDEIAAEAMGVNTTRYKVLAFVIAAFFAGIAGGLYASERGVALSPIDAGFQKSFDVIIMVVLGGMGSISGAAIAAAILTILPEFLRDPPSIAATSMLVTLGIGIALVLLFTSRRVRNVLIVIAAAGVYELVRWGAARRGINLAEYRMIIYALALILMMILRPQGLFGVREIWSAWRLRPLRPGRDSAAGGGSGEAGGVPRL